MSTPTVEQFRTRYPEFTEALYSDARVTLAIADADTEISSTVWGALYERGVCAFVAHTLRVTGSFSEVAPVVSRTVGDVSITFGNRSNASDDFYSTKYGAEYKRLQRLVGAGPMVLP